jgi:hypothetical protein
MIMANYSKQPDKSMTAKDILFNWFAKLNAFTTISMILAGTVLIISFFSWAYAVIFPLTTEERMCPEDTITIRFVDCPNTLQPEAAFMTAYFLGAALALVFITCMVHKISKSRMGSIAAAIMVPLIVVAAVMMFWCVTIAFFLIYSFIGAFAAPIPFLVLFPIAVYAHEIIKNDRQKQRTTFHSTSIAQQFTEVTPNDDSGKQL